MDDDEVIRGTRLPTEANAKVWLTQARDLRQEWAQFATSHVTLLDRFKKCAAPLSDEFLARYQQLLEKKLAFVKSLPASLEAAAGHVWILPEPSASLEEFELQLQKLVQWCHDEQKRVHEARLRVARELESLCTLSSPDPSMKPALSAAIAVAKSVIATLRQETGDLRATRVPAQLEALSGWRQLLEDGQRDERWSSRSSLTVEDRRDLFDVVTKELGIDVALGTLRGLLTMTLSTTVVSGAAAVAVSAAMDVATADLATHEQVEQLRAKFNGAPAPVAAPRRERPAVSGEPAQGSEQRRDALESILTAIQSRVGGLTADGQTPPATQVAVLKNADRAASHVLQILKHRGQRLQQFRDELHEALKLLAESQSAIRTEHQRSRRSDGSQPEQERLFQWLRGITDEAVEGFVIARYMKQSDQADPDKHADLGFRLHQADQRWKKARRGEELLGEVKAAVAELTEDRFDEGWNLIDRLVVEFLRCDRKSSDPELRDILREAADLFPSSDESGDGAFRPSKGLAEVLREVSRILEESSADALSHWNGSREPDANLLAVRELLQHRPVAIVGGIEKPEVVARIRAELDVSQVYWIPASHHDRVCLLGPKLKNAVVAVLLTGLIGHKHNDLRKECLERGIAVVQTRQTAGFGVNQLAASILQQASERLSQPVTKQTNPQS